MRTSTSRPGQGAAPAAVADGGTLEPIDPEAFVGAMRMLPSGVVMVTVNVDGRPWGLTISSCSSLSAEPPQILISLGTRTVTLRQILEHGVFGVSLLAAHHGDVAAAGSAAGVPKFVDQHCHVCEDGGSPIPRVRDAPYHLDCRMVGAHEYADHTVIVGAVERVHLSTPQPRTDPLVYFDRAYRLLGQPLQRS